PELRRGDIFLSLSAGSGTNIRPDLVMDTFAKDSGLLPDPYRFMINRDEVYADLGEAEPGSDRFVPLIGLGTTME
ncbi:MAG TPA: Fe-S oxidoreductase, partial [Lachnospiraceae bacterium]|nr:Fe-S oxidoreductase [Lachnospiraceae bacterium]